METNQEPVSPARWIALTLMALAFLFAVLALLVVFTAEHRSELGTSIGVMAASLAQFAIAFSVWTWSGSMEQARRLDEHLKGLAALLDAQLAEQRQTNARLRTLDARRN